jgi:integrase
MPKVKTLTRRILESLQPSASGDYYLMEEGGRGALRGFGVRVRRRSIQYVVRFRRRTQQLGPVDLLPLETAREQARQLLIQLRCERNDPALTGRRKTVAELAQLYLDQVVAPRNKPRTLDEYRRAWRLHVLPRLGTLRLTQVTPEQVLRMKHELADRPIAANRALQQLAAAFAFAKKLRWIHDNPADERTVDRYAETPKSRSLEPEDYRRLGLALQEAEARAILPVRTIAALRLLLLTGARPHEILSAELAWVELGSYPRIRRPLAKGDRPGKKPKGRSIWLGPAAVEIIRSLPRPPGCRWVIPGDEPDKPLTIIDKAWARICKMAGVEGATPKSARHAFRSAGPVAGVAPEHMRELMGHSSLKMIEEVYWHARAEDQVGAAGAMDQHVARLMSAADPAEAPGGGPPGSGNPPLPGAPAAAAN